mgnify:CR=1 FL=1
METEGQKTNDFFLSQVDFIHSQFNSIFLRKSLKMVK